MKNITKIITIILALAFVICPLASCNGGGDDGNTLRIGALKGPTGIGMTYIIGKEGYDVTLHSSPDDVTSAILSGSVDIAAVPVNLASALYKKTNGEIKCAAVCTLGVLYLLENGNSIGSVADLKGKTVYSTGKAATPEYILKRILRENGLDPEKDVEIKFLTENAELAAKMTSSDVAVGVLPEPNVTSVMMQNENVRVALDLTKEWDKISENSSKLVQGVIVVSKKLAEAHPELARKFLSDLKESAERVNADPASASLIIEKEGIIPKAKIAEKAIPSCNVVCITGEEMKLAVSDTLSELGFTKDQEPGDDFWFDAERK